MEKELKNSVLARFKKGDAQAFQEVFDFYYRNLFIFAYKLIGNKEDAEDVTMQIFEKLFSRFDQFQTEPNIKAFLYISVRNKSLDYIRANGYREERQKTFAREMENEVSLRLEYDVYQDVLEAIHNAVNKLPKTCQKVFRMMFFDDLDSIEVAQKLGISPDNVRNQKKRALQLLRVELRDKNLMVLLAYLLFTLFSEIFFLLFYVSIG